MPSTPYMKLYIGDYLGDTQHLSCLEHGAYILLIMAYWQNGGPIKDDPKLLRRLTRTSPKEFQKCSENVLKMFKSVDGLLVHKRVDLEISKREQVSTAARDSVSARWYGRITDVLPTNYGRNTTPIVHSPIPEEYNTNTKRLFKKPTIEEVEQYCLERRNNVDSQKWLDHYESNGWMVGKSKMKSWKAAIRTWEHNGFNSKEPERKRSDEPYNADGHLTPTPISQEIRDILDRQYKRIKEGAEI